MAPFFFGISLAALPPPEAETEPALGAVETDGALPLGLPPEAAEEVPGAAFTFRLAMKKIPMTKTRMVAR
jgi:hypothetical protein